MMDFAHKKVVVLGLARSGFHAAQLLARHGATVVVSEKNDDSHHRELMNQLTRVGIDGELGMHTRELIESADCIVLSPGIPLFSEPVQWAKNKGIEIISEIELGFQFCPAGIVATSGTNGKTTVTTLIALALQRTDRRTFALGNIGDPFCSKIEEMSKNDIVSLEVSSFQLEAIKEFHPKVSVLLNFTPDHLDRYANVKEYLDAKKRIFMNQDKHDYVVLNWADETLRGLEKEIPSRVVFFNTGDMLSARHRLNANQMAVVKVAEIYGVSFDACLNLFKNFKGIEHRMEFVRTINGVDFINDSKATNIESTKWALDTVSRPIILIAGGRDKGSDFNSMRSALQGKVKALILFGEARQKIRHALSSVVDVSEASDIENAIVMAHAKAAPNDCVLLSPMCASFDMFKNYEERGKIFKAIVQRL